MSGHRTLNRHGLSSEYPTDVQAEVLVKNEIPIESIKSVSFSTKEDLAMSKSALIGHNCDHFVVEPHLFSL